MKITRLYKAILKFILGLTLGLAVAALIAFNFVLAWVATGPRSLDALSPYIESAFTPPDHKYAVSIGETWLVWDGWKHPVDIRLRNVKVFTNERHAYSRFPEISLGLDLLRLFAGRVIPTSLTITHPAIGLLQNEDRSVSFGLESEEPAPDASAAIPFAAIIAPFAADDNSSLGELHLVSIVNADVTLTSKTKGVVFKTSGADFTFKRTRQGLHAFIAAAIAYDNYQSLVSAEITKKTGSNLIDGDLEVSKIMPAKLANLFIDNEVLSAMKFPLSGKVSVHGDTDGNLQKLNFSVDGAEGTFDSQRLDGALPINNLHMEGTASHTADTSTLTLTAFTADLHGTLLSAKGTATLRGNDPEIHAEVLAKNIAAANVHMLWPPKLAPITRDWVTTNITDGKITETKATIAIAPGDITKPELPKEDIDALVTIEGAKLRYLPDHPELTALNGKVHIDGLSLDATLDSAHFMKDTKLSAGRVYIADLNPDNPYIKVTITADSNAKDAIHLLELPPFKFAPRLNLLADAAEGKVKGQAELGFKFFAEHKDKDKPGDPDVDFSVKAELSGMSQPGFMKKFDGKNVNGAIAVDNQSLEFTGSGTVNGAEIATAKIKYLFKPDQAYDTFIDATAIVPVESLPRFGYPAFDFLKGALSIKANVKQGKTVEYDQATIDLTNAAIDFPALKLQKPAKQSATLTLIAEKKDDLSTIPDFHFTDSDTDAKGSAELSKDMLGLQRVTLTKLTHARTDLTQLLYQRTDTARIVEAHGSALDLSPWFEKKDPKEDTDFSFEHFPPLQLKMDVGQIIFGKTRELTDVKGTLTCDATHCENATIAGATSDHKPFNFRILRNPKGKRQLSLHAQSAGVFLKDLNIFDGMEGGDLTITGNYTDPPASALHGRLDINEHTIKDAPILAKIVSLASLTGIFDTLQGKGIHFDHLTVPFTLEHDVITLETAKSHGNALGMTAEGTITYPKAILDLNGTIVPAYSLNHVLGNVPLIGGVLTGGDGQGVFAARYTVKGTQSNPEVSVNPLSILTPGFLRGVFDIMDSPKKKEEDEE